MPPKPTPRIAPSFFNRADFANLALEASRLEAAGADLIHLDVMDGQFVHPLTFGPTVIKSLRPATRLPFDAHLMVVNPAALLPDFIDAGCDVITLHPEAGGDIRAMLQTIRAGGKRTGLALKPATSLDVLTPYLDILDQILILTVEPGMGGQALIPLHDKIRAARTLIDVQDHPMDLMVDGGIHDGNAADIVAAGADILVSGAFIYRDGPDHLARQIRALKG